MICELAEVSSARLRTQLRATVQWVHGQWTPADGVECTKNLFRWYRSEKVVHFLTQSGCTDLMTYVNLKSKFSVPLTRSSLQTQSKWSIELSHFLNCQTPGIGGWGGVNHAFCRMQRGRKKTKGSFHELTVSQRQVSFETCKPVDCARVLGCCRVRAECR